MTVQDPMASVYHRCSFSSRRVASLESAAAVSNRRPQSRTGGRSLEPRAAMAAVGAVGSRAERESCPGTAALVLAEDHAPGRQSLMAERALRGTRLGATSYENDRNTDLAPRQEVSFDCPNGHHFSVPFAAEAEIPTTWECRVCGATALTVTGDLPTPKKAKAPRTHWDMLLERRSIEDLEEVLAERLALIRAGRAGTQTEPGKTQRLKSA